MSAIDILNFYLDLRYDIRKNTNTKKRQEVKNKMATAIMKQKEVPEMDDVEEIISKISEDSPYKRRPTQKRTWMTVPEMGKLLGLKKTDRYWLVHKNVF